jgi:hypothetical protein
MERRSIGRLEREPGTVRKTSPGLGVEVASVVESVVPCSTTIAGVARRKTSTAAAAPDPALEELQGLATELAASSQNVLFRVREAQEELRMGDPLVVLVHIPKTAGTSLKSMFARAYPRDALTDAGNYLRSERGVVAKLKSARLAKGRVAVGHVPYGLAREHLPPETRYVTFLREPIERILSHYHGHIRRTQRNLRLGVPTAASLEEALDTGIPELNNLATRLLCSDPSPMGYLRSTALEEAKTNLRDFAFVGITERFDESTVLLQRTLKIPAVPYERQHVGIGRARREDIPADQRARILEMNSLDLELYKFGSTLFEAAAAAAGEGLAAEAEVLRAQSELATDEERTATEKALRWLNVELPAESRKPIAELRGAARAEGISDPALRRAAKALGARVESGSGGKHWVRA